MIEAVELALCELLRLGIIEEHEVPRLLEVCVMVTGDVLAQAGTIEGAEEEPHTEPSAGPFAVSGESGFTFTRRSTT